MQIGDGVNPLLQVDLNLRDEISGFLDALAARGFLNRIPAQLKAPKRYFDEIDSSDLAARDFQLRAEPELTQSEWIDGASDGAKYLAIGVAAATGILATISQYAAIREGEAMLIDLKSAQNPTALSKKIADSRGLLSLSAIAIVGIDIAIFALVVWAVLG